MFSSSNSRVPWKENTTDRFNLHISQLVHTSAHTHTHGPEESVSCAESLVACDRSAGNSPEQRRRRVLSRDSGWVTSEDKGTKHAWAQTDDHHSARLWAAGCCSSSWLPLPPEETKASPAPRRNSSWNRSTAGARKKGATSILIFRAARGSVSQIQLFDPPEPDRMAPTRLPTST